LRRSVKNAPRTERISARPSPGPAAQFPKVSVIVPAYNEAENIHDCAIAMRESTPLSVDNLEVLIVDDRSTDETKDLGQTLQPQPGDPRPKNISRSAATWEAILGGQKLGRRPSCSGSNRRLLIIYRCRRAPQTRGDRNCYRHSRNRENRLVHLSASAGKASVLPSG
jgi:glycosyltransferase involved in cell wall biosynthesis